MRRSLTFVLVVVAPAAAARSARAFQATLAADQDTFINSAAADNNNGASPSLYTGHNGMGGAMRTLVHFAIPAAWQGHATVTQAVLSLVTRGTTLDQTMPPSPATASLQAVSAAWTEGSGFGDTKMMNTVGQACGTSGATWNQPNCAGGTPWMGGSVSATVSGAGAVPASLESTVTLDSGTAGNAGMLADLQGWIDSPAANRGWRIASSTESAADAEVQRFYSREVAGKGPTLLVTGTCRPGSAEIDGGCMPGAADGGASHDSGPVGSPPAQGGSGCSCAVERVPFAGGAGWIAAVLIGLAVAVGRRARTP